MKFAAFQQQKHHRDTRIWRRRRADKNTQSKYVIFPRATHVQMCISLFSFSACVASTQSFAKAVKKVTRCLPQDGSKKKRVIQSIAQSVGLLAPSIYQRVARQLPCKLRHDVVKFYCCDDISYQILGERDTIVVRHSGLKPTHQKRILLYQDREALQLFWLEYPGSGLCPSHRK